MLTFSSWSRIGGAVGLTAAAGLVAAMFAGQEPAEAHNPGPREPSLRSSSAAPAPAPVRVVYNVPVVSTGNQPRPSGQVTEAARLPAKVHVERAPGQPFPEVGMRSEKPPLRVGYKSEPKLPETATTAARPVAGLDLNRASAAELDAVSGGRIGKAIVRGRPYSTPEDLVRKRILTKDAFARMKDKVVVR